MTSAKSPISHPASAAAYWNACQNLHAARARNREAHAEYETLIDECGPTDGAFEALESANEAAGAAFMKTCDTYCDMVRDYGRKVSKAIAASITY